MFKKMGTNMLVLPFKTHVTPQGRTLVTIKIGGN